MTTTIGYELKDRIAQRNSGYFDRAIFSKKLLKTLQSIFNIPLIRHIAPRWAESFTKIRIFRKALIEAYTTTGGHYFPKWSSYFFDPQFQAHGVTLIMASYHKNSTRPDSYELAKNWAEQMTWLSEEAKQRHIKEMVPVAVRFLLCLESNLMERPEFSSIINGMQRKTRLSRNDS